MTVDQAEYVAYWASVTDRSPGDVYVPFALTETSRPKDLTMKNQPAPVADRHQQVAENHYVSNETDFKPAPELFDPAALQAEIAEAVNGK